MTNTSALYLNQHDNGICAAMHEPSSLYVRIFCGAKQSDGEFIHFRRKNIRKFSLTLSRNMPVHFMYQSISVWKGAQCDSNALA